MDSKHIQYSMFKQAGLGWPTGMIEIIIFNKNDDEVLLQIKGR